MALLPYGAGKQLDRGEVVFDVKAFGATGNGTTNDTVAIQAAATAAAGATLFFPIGTYLTTGTITLTQGMRVLFAGRSAIVKYTGTTDAFYAASLKGLKIEGAGTIDISGAGTSANGIHLAGTWFVTIDEIKIIQGPASSIGIFIETSQTGGNNYGSYCIDINNPDLWVGAGAAGIKTIRTTGDGIPSVKKTTHLIIRNGWCANKINGLFLSQASTVFIDGYVVDTGTNGYYLEYCDNVMLRPGELGPVSNYAIVWGDLKLATALVSATVYTTLTVAPIGQTVVSGDTFTIGSGATFQNVVASAGAAVDSTTITVTSFTANAAYAIGVPVVNTAKTTHQGNALFLPSYAGGSGTNGFMDTSIYQPTVFDRSSTMLKGSAGVNNYNVNMLSNYNYNESFDLIVQGGGAKQTLLKWGDANGLTLNGGTGAVTVSQDLFVYKAGATATAHIKDSTGTNQLLMYHTGTYGQIESTTGFVLLSDNGSTTITGTVNPELTIKYNSGTYGAMTLHHDDTNGIIGTSKGNLNLTSTSGIINAGGIPIATTTAIQTLTNTRITKRTQILTTATTITPAGDTNDLVVATAQASAFSLVNPTGTPTDGQDLLVRIKATAAFAITYGTLYQSSGVNLLPTSTVAAKTITLRFIYDLTAVKWVLLAVDGTGY